MVQANDKLRDASEIDETSEANATTRPERQPALRKTLPEHLPRVDNLIPVPPEQTPCPRCRRSGSASATT